MQPIRPEYSDHQKEQLGLGRNGLQSSPFSNSSNADTQPSGDKMIDDGQISLIAEAYPAGGSEPNLPRCDLT
jgi:hypothetical protein